MFIMSKKFTLLVIEDDEASFKLIEAALRTIDINILYADDGQRGLDLFAENYVDLVLLDIQMPGMNGFEVLKHIKTIKPGIFVIAQTAYSTAGDKEECIKQGFSDFLSKPINIMQLRKLILKYKDQSEL